MTLEKQSVVSVGHKIVCPHRMNVFSLETSLNRKESFLLCPFVQLASISK